MSRVGGTDGFRSWAGGLPMARDELSNLLTAKPTRESAPRKITDTFARPPEREVSV